MKRAVLTGVIVLLTAPTTAAFAGSRLKRSGKLTPNVPSRARLTGFACHTALPQSARSISVRAVMRPITGTQKMEMRFELQSRPSPSAAFSDQPGAGLNSWISPADPTLGQRPGDVWIVSHPVSGLPAPATYRYRVSFRWTGTTGRVLATRTLPSVDCYEPELRPNLLVRSIA